MAGKLSFLAGFGAGYVLGARAGRERYEQIASKAQRFWQDPRVHEKAERVQEVAKEKGGAAASVIGEKAVDAGTRVASKAREQAKGLVGDHADERADEQTTGTRSDRGAGSDVGPDDESGR